MCSSAAAAAAAPDPFQAVLNVNVPPPFWMTGILGITQVEIATEEEDVVTIGDTNLGVDVDTDAFISLLEDISLQ